MTDRARKRLPVFGLLRSWRCILGVPRTRFHSLAQTQHWGQRRLAAHPSLSINILLFASRALTMKFRNPSWVEVTMPALAPTGSATTLSPVPDWISGANVPKKESAHSAAVGASGAGGISGGGTSAVAS
jgi:hypothetical protein